MATFPSLNNTLGALFIGLTVSTVLYGTLLVQSLDYYRRYPSDKVVYKVIVILLLLLVTAHQAFIAHCVYYYTISNFTNLFALVGKPVWSLSFQLLIGAVIGFVVKFLFALRVWRFSYGNVWLTAFLLLLDFGQLGLAITFAVQSYALPALPDIKNLRVIGVAALVIGVVNDISIAISLCYYLQSMRSCYTQSNSLIRSLTLYAIGTGVVTSALSFATLIIYNYMPDNLIFVSCYFVLSKLYAVSFVAALNTRQIIRGRSTDEAKKTSSHQNFTAQRARSLNIIPLQSPETVRQNWDVEHHTGEEIGVPTPIASSENVEYVQRQERPHYTDGW